MITFNFNGGRSAKWNKQPILENGYNFFKGVISLQRNYFSFVGHFFPPSIPLVRYCTKIFPFTLEYHINFAKFTSDQNRFASKKRVISPQNFARALRTSLHPGCQDARDSTTLSGRLGQRGRHGRRGWHGRRG